MVRPFVISSGPMTQGHGLFVALHSEGLVGWGECPTTPSPMYCPETTGTAWHIASEYLIPSMLGADIEETQDLEPYLGRVRGHHFCKGMFDMAAWDLVSKRDGLSMARKLAQPYPEGAKERVACGWAIGIQGIAETIAAIGAARERGFQRMKLKIRPGHELALARAARLAFPDIPLMLDANSAYGLEDAPIFQAMDELRLLMIEQPLDCDDIYDHSRLHPLIKTPLCLDESIHSVGDTRLALALKACDIINIKPGRVGGWTEARRIHDLCRANGIPVWIGGMLESGLGIAAKVAIASLPGVTLPGDLEVSYMHYTLEVTEPIAINPEDSTITVPTKPGIGVEIDPAGLAAAIARHESFVSTKQVAVPEISR